ncbi:MAG TPA: hypothetical protein VFV32_11065 [Acidimicrobiales bacterium]|nr:hypothetical protein [Acidimicrobiales bacterium]
MAARLVSLLVSGATATCGITDLEVAATAPGGDDHAEVVAERRLFPRVAIDDEVLDRAIEVQGQLLDPPVPLSALVVAAAAERAGLIVLHHDASFDRIAAVTGQPTEWVTATGTAP